MALSMVFVKLQSPRALVVTEEHEAAGEEDGVAEAGVLEVEDGHHEHEEGDGAPVGEEGDGGGGPGGVEQRDHVHHWAPGVPHAALEHGQQREHGQDVPPPPVQTQR